MTALTIDKQISLGSLGNIFIPNSYVEFWDNSLSEQYIPHSTSISSSIDKVLSFLLSQDIVIENSNDVEDFLKDNYGIIAYLYEVPERIQGYFGKSDLKIGVFSDPESNENQSELYFEVETSLTPEEANEKLSTINREWLFSLNDQDLMSLNITLKFL